MASIASAASPPVRDHGRDRALVGAWLKLVALMIVAIVVVGGITRLSHAGLSITEWKPLHGVIPPLSDADWQDEFARYRQIPEFKVLNADMTLSGFKGIFWWEWTHRLLARLIGVVVLVPMILLWAAGRIEPRLKPKLVALFLLGGLQGAAGWWMVASGLSERTDVSQYRLAIHLTLAIVILAFVVWVIRGLTPTPLNDSRNRLRGAAGAIVGLTILQVFLGGLVAGLDAGLTFNTWPLMDGTLVPSGLFGQSPAWRNLFENVATVQFDHRLGAYVLLGLAIAHALQARGTPYAPGALSLVLLVTLQAMLGVATLLWAAPLALALAHQLGAVVVLIAAVSHFRTLWPALPMPVPA